MAWLRIIILSGIFLITGQQLFADAPPDMTLKISPCGWREAKVLSGYNYDDCGERTPQPLVSEEDVRAFFGSLGMNFPEGSYIRHNPLAKQLLHYNTAENHNILGKILQGDCSASAIVIDATFVSFPRKEIEDLSRRSETLTPTPNQILSLWRTGHGSLLHTMKVPNRSGVNAQCQSVMEEIYATEFETDAAYTVGDALTPNHLPLPSHWDTWEAGAMLNFTPTITDYGKTVEVLLVPELCQLRSYELNQCSTQWSNGEQVTVTTRYPKFHSWQMNSFVVMNNGQTEVLGSFLSPDKKDNIYLFLTARIIDSTNNEDLTESDEETP